MVDGCGKDLREAAAGEWAWEWLDDFVFKLGTYRFATGSSVEYPCGGPQNWCGRDYTPMCISCARKHGFIW